MKNLAWHPMETAPKDGTRVLLAYRIHDLDIIDFEVGRWIPNYGCPGWRAAVTFLEPVAWSTIPDLPNSMNPTTENNGNEDG